MRIVICLSILASLYAATAKQAERNADNQRTGILSRQNYTYDPYANRISASRDQGSLACDPVCELNRTITASSNHISGATYDDAGNVTFVQDTVNGTTYNATYTYDGLGMMTHATAGSDDRVFVYTADDERLASGHGLSWTWTVRGLDAKILREFTSTQSGAGAPPSTGYGWLKDYFYRELRSRAVL